MAPPNRKEFVERAMAKLSAHLRVHTSQMEDVRRRTLPYIRDEFPDKQDWMLMVKTERTPDFIPVDILWHLPSGHHVDVNTADDVGGDMRQIKAAWTDNKINARQKNGQWKPISVDDAKLQPLIDARPAPEEPPAPSDTHRYVGGGNDTGTCDQCGQSRDAAVHAVPEGRVRHNYDGGEHDTGVCDVCGQTRAAAIHQAAPSEPTGDHEQRLTALESWARSLSFPK